MIITIIINIYIMVIMIILIINAISLILNYFILVNITIYSHLFIY